MKIKPATSHSARIIQLAFTLPEVIVGVAIVVVMFVTLYGGMTSGFAITQLARENLRGTQIMLERVEGIRLYNWNQLVYSNMIPTTFTNYYYPLASNGQSQGIPYYGTMTISNAAMNPTANYSTNLRLISVSVMWTNGIMPRTRSVQTYVAMNGIQNYVYNATNR